MLKKSLLLMLFVALLAPWAVKGQTLTVYEGDDASTYVPVIGYYTDNYGKCEFVMLADSLTDMNGMAISKMKFNITAIGSYGTGWNTGTFQVFMKEINASTISAYQGTTDATIVYEGAFANPAVGDYEITFTNEYEYHGGNLLIGIYRTVKGNYKEATFKGKSVTGASLANYSSSSLASVSATQRNFVPKTTFTYHEPPTCPKPTNLHANLTEGNGAIATLVWTENGSAANWEVIYGTDPTLETYLSPITTGFNVDGSTISCDLSGLTAETPYYAKVKAVCDAGVDESDYTDIIEFTPSNYYTITVNDPTTTTNSYIPVYYYLGSYSTTKSQFIIPSTNLTNMQWGEIRKLTFYNQTATVDYGAAKFNVYLATTSNTTLSSFVEWSTMTKVVTNGSISVSGNKMEIVFDTPYTYTGDNIIIGFSQTSSGTSATYSDKWVGVTGASGASRYYISSESSNNFLPKVTFTYAEGEEPDCLPVSEPSYDNLQVNSVELNWTPSASGETAWKLQYKKTSDADWTTYPTAITEKPFPLGELTENTTYQWQVAAWCDTENPDGISDYVAGENFTTKQNPVVVGDSWGDNFEGESCGWVFDNSGQTNQWVWGTATSNSETHSMYVSNDNGTTNAYSNSLSVVYARKLLTFADGKYEFSFNWKANGESNYDYIRAWLAPTSFEFTAGQLPNGGTTSTDFKNYISSTETGWIPLDGTVETGGKLNLQTTWQSKSIAQNVTADTWCLVFMWCNDGGTNGNPPAAIDNVSITRLACPYDVTGLEVAETPAPTAHTATINWTAGEASQWQIAWSKDPTFATAETDIVSSPTKELQELEAISTYYVKVRAYCGGDDYGSWSSTVNFETECEAISTFPWDYNFNSDATGDFSKPCWVNDKVSGSYKFKVSNSSNGSNTTNQLYMLYNSGNVAKLVLPELEIPSNKTYQFMIDVWRTTYYDSYNDGIGVYANTTRDLEGATQLGFLYRVCTKTDGGIVTSESSNGWYTYTFDIPYHENCFIILRGVGDGGNSTYVDNFVIRQAPDCDTPTGLAVTANSQTPEGATITWDNVEATSWMVEYKKSTEDDYTALAEPVTSPTHTFLGLDAETTYNVRVKVNCDGVTYPTNPISFTTQHTCPAPKNLVVNSVSDSQAVLSWTPGYNETEWTVKYKKNADSEYTTAEPNPVTTTPTITLNELVGGTTYDVQIYGCNSEHVYTVSKAFTTAYSTPFAEPFNSGNIPANWNNYVGLLTDDVLSGNTPLSSGTGQWAYTITRVFGAYHAVDNIYGATSCRDWLVTPNILVGSGMSLSFDLALTDYGSTDPIEFPEGQADDKFIVLISTDNAHTWTILRQWDNAGSEYVYNEIAPAGESVYIDLASYSGQSVRIAFYGESTVAVTGEDNDMHIDNVEINTTPACFRPASLKASDVTNHSVTLTWLSGSDDQTAWEFKYNKGADFDPAEAGTLVENITANPYTFDKTLDAESDYYFYVRGNCGEPSAWNRIPCSFTTTASAPAPTTFDYTEVGADWVDLYWNAPAGDLLSGYGIYYVASTTTPDAPTAETPATVTINDPTAPTAEEPYRLSGLDNETRYYIWIRANHETDYSTWKALEDSYITTLEACPTPTSISATTTQYTADITWSGSTDSYNIQYRIAAQTTTNKLLFQGFEDGMGDWTTIIQSTDPDNVAECGIFEVAAKTGTYGFRFSSADRVTSEDTYDQYLISPMLTNVGSLEFVYKKSGSMEETFVVGYSTTTTDLSSFTWGSTQTANTSSWQTFSDGNMPSDAKYFAIHYTSQWKYRLYIDDITIYEQLPVGEWTPTTPLTSTETSIQLDNLTPGIKYDVRVQGVCGDNTSYWNETYSFTTAPVRTFSTSGNWNVAANWTPSGIPDPDEDVIIAAAAEVPSGYFAQPRNVTMDELGSITIKNGGQFKSNSAGLSAKVQKTISNSTSWGSGTTANNGWYTISSPIVGNLEAASVTGLITTGENNDYDLYYYDEANSYWRTYKTSGDNPGFQIVPGMGYLYASQDGTTVEFSGVLNYNPVDNISLTAESDNPKLAGWNLIGNPFSYNIYKGTGAAINNNKLATGYYILSNDNTWLAKADNEDAINPCQGILVKAIENVDLTINNTNAQGGGSKANSDYIKLMVNNNDYEDVTYAWFDNVIGLNKISHRNNEAPMLYIPQDGENYAIAAMGDNTEAFNLNFKAMTTGKYTLSFNTKGDFSYLHVIDRVTGEDIDMILTGKYEFIGSPRDNENRFIVKLNYNANINDVEASSDIFVYQSGDELIVNGEGTLQVYDVMGRFVGSYEVNGDKRLNASQFANNVYIFRMVGDSVKTQKIVIR